MWTQDEVKTLHQAHRTVNPTSISFWGDIAEMIGDKSEMECRQKWFSLAKTPEPKRPKQRNKQAKSGVVTGSIIHKVDDDIFNSTPMRSAFAIGENIDISDAAFEELGDISNMNVGSAIKIKTSHHNGGSLPSNNGAMEYPHGYKTYLQKLGRSMRQKQTQKTNSNEAPFKFGKKLTGRVNEGDIEVKCKLSPGGTLQVDTFGDTDIEDDYLENEDENE